MPSRSRLALATHRPERDMKHERQSSPKVEKKKENERERDRERETPTDLLDLPLHVVELLADLLHLVFTSVDQPSGAGCFPSEAVVVQSRKLFFFAVQESVETILEGDRQALDAAVHFLPPCDAWNF